MTLSNDFVIWRNGHEWQYALSMASTWIWAPALFVSSSMAHNNGLLGLCMFIIPNALTLILFGWLSGLYAPASALKRCNVTDALADAWEPQRCVHRVMSLMLLLASTAVQLVGLHTLFDSLTDFAFPKIATILITFLACGSIVWLEGIKACIKTDVAKYAVLLLCGVCLAVYAVLKGEFTGFGGINNPDFLPLAATFGITTAIGLFSAPYVDNTFWQRAFCISKERRLPVFTKAAVSFSAIPLIFGLIGFYSAGDTSWTLGDSFSSGIPAVLVIIAVVAALVSTVDSNLCAASALYHEEKDNMPHIIMCGMFTIAALLFAFTDWSVVQWFLFYGTARTCMFVPTVLIMLNKYDKYRLFVATILAIFISTIGYALTKEFAYTLIALILPLAGMKWWEDKKHVTA